MAAAALARAVEGRQVQGGCDGGDRDDGGEAKWWWVGY